MTLTLEQLTERMTAHSYVIASAYTAQDRILAVNLHHRPNHDDCLFWAVELEMWLDGGEGKVGKVMVLETQDSCNALDLYNRFTKW